MTTTATPAPGLDLGPATRPQPAPTPNGYPPVWETVMADVRQMAARGGPAAPGADPEVEAGVDAAIELLLADMAARDALGRARYGTALQPFNGRAALADLYQELLDAIVYARQALIDADLSEDEHEAIETAVYRPLLALATLVCAVATERAGRLPTGQSLPANAASLPQANTGRSA